MELKWEDSKHFKFQSKAVAVKTSRFKYRAIAGARMQEGHRWKLAMLSPVVKKTRQDGLALKTPTRSALTSTGETVFERRSEKKNRRGGSHA